MLATLAVAGCTSKQPGGPNSAAASSVRSNSAGGSSVGSSGPAASPSSTTSGSGSASANATGSGSAPTHPAAIWPTYHHDAARTGSIANAPPVTRLHVVASAKLDAAVYASPLVLHDSKGNLVIAATENNTLYALRDDGSIAWSKHLGTAVNGHTLPCGNIDPSGITGTPAYDPASGLVFAVTFVAGPKHVLVALDAETGAVAWTRPVDPPGSQAKVEQERGALLLAEGKVWIPYGGLYGDCGPYHGYLVGVSTSGQGDAVIYQVPSSREAGIWTAAGAAYDDNGHLYVAVGNGAQTDPSAKYDMSDSVIELSTGGKVVSYFAPASWASENAADLDLGTTGPLLLPNGKVFVAGKDGKAYLLQQGALGGVGANVPKISLCRAFGGAAFANGVVFVPCTDGVRAVRVSGSAMTTLWHASAPGSPVVGNGVVLTTTTGGTLYALDPSSGAVKAKTSLGDSITRFGTPALSADGHLYMGTATGHLVVVQTS